MYVAQEVMTNIKNNIYPDVIKTIRDDGNLFFSLIKKASKDRKRMDETVPVSFGISHTVVNYENQFVEDIKTGDGFIIDLNVDYTDLHN